MRIAFVGKGGSGKSTIAYYFTKFLQNKNIRFGLVDADINMHQSTLYEIQPNCPRIVEDKITNEILTYLKGENKSIKNLDQFRKSTPPAKGSNIINWADTNDPFLTKYTTPLGNGVLLEIGGYTEEKISSTCYHAPLAVLENILSHSIDHEMPIVMDMVAGTDAFANTLYMHTDIFIFILEPTKRSIKVFETYLELSETAGVADRVFSIVNKVANQGDIEYVRSLVNSERILGTIDLHANNDKNVVDEMVSGAKLEPLLTRIYEMALSKVQDPNNRLKRLHDFHLNYIKSPFVVERFGDISAQIDREFKYEK